jgi:hypothetical protein
VITRCLREGAKGKEGRVSGLFIAEVDLEKKLGFEHGEEIDGWEVSGSGGTPARGKR